MILARNLLNSTDYNISEIVSKIGVSSKSYFLKIFKETYDISPSDYRKNNKPLETNNIDALNGTINNCPSCNKTGN